MQFLFLTSLEFIPTKRHKLFLFQVLVNIL